MGRIRRPHPKRLAVKLRAIRESLNATQKRMIHLLDYHESVLRQGHIAEFERGKREPNLLVLLHYARLAEVSMEELVDDTLNMPDKPKKQLHTLTRLLEREIKARSK